MNVILLIDGNALMHRAYHALPLLTGPDGVPTNVLYGFLAMLHKVMGEVHPTHIVVCFDTPKPTFRDVLLPEYRAQRPKADDTFIVQIPLVQEMVEKAGIAKYLQEGFEADDIIGTIAHTFRKDNKVYILTGDKDLMQLVDNNVSVLTPKMGMSSTSVYDVEAVKEKMGVEPSLIPDLKALMGDSSDNYKGAKGIGPKTAVKLLQQFHSVEHLLQHIHDIKEPRIQSLIEEHRANITLSKELATIRLDVPLEISLEKIAFNSFNAELKDYLLQKGIRAITYKIFNIQPDINPLIKPVEPVKKEEAQLDLFT